MTVGIYATRCHSPPGGINFLSSWRQRFTQQNDPAVTHTNIA
jgi:hypothetical protein